MMLRNLDPPLLCNRSRFVAKTMKHYVLEAAIITGNYNGVDVFVPSIPLIPSDLPFECKRLPFPVHLSFAASVNEAQGWSLKVVGMTFRHLASHMVSCMSVVHVWDLFKT